MQDNRFAEADRTWAYVYGSYTLTNRNNKTDAVRLHLSLQDAQNMFQIPNSELLHTPHCCVHVDDLHRKQLKAETLERSTHLKPPHQQHSTGRLEIQATHTQTKKLPSATSTKHGCHSHAQKLESASDFVTPNMGSPQQAQSDLAHVMRMIATH